MKKFKCPECGGLFEYLVDSIEGGCTYTPDGKTKLEHWERRHAICENCGYEEIIFEVIEVE